VTEAAVQGDHERQGFASVVPLGHVEDEPPARVGLFVASGRVHAHRYTLGDRLRIQIVQPIMQGRLREEAAKGREDLAQRVERFERATRAAQTAEDASHPVGCGGGVGKETDGFVCSGPGTSHLRVKRLEALRSFESAERSQGPRQIETRTLEQAAQAGVLGRLKMSLHMLERGQYRKARTA
jgi:hypothetical protein